MRAPLALALALAAAAASAAASRTPGYVLTPFGEWPAECVHAVASGTHVHADESEQSLVLRHAERATYAVPRCRSELKPKRAPPRRVAAGAAEPLAPATHGDGWQVYVHQDVGDNVTALLGVWPVPPAPQEQAQTLFTFTGLQNIDWVPPQPQPDQPFDIIQPVLQYGYSAAGGGDYWTIASWYVTLTNDVLYSELERVSEGDVIFGNMTWVADSTWFIDSVNQANNKHSSLTVHRQLLKTQPWTYVTLEVYDVDTCLQYPPEGTQLPYTKLQLFVGGAEQQADWSVGTQGQTPPICGASIEIESPDAVTITF
jgi:hypothetical protein